MYVVYPLVGALSMSGVHLVAQHQSDHNCIDLLHTAASLDHAVFHLAYLHYVKRKPCHQVHMLSVDLAGTAQAGYMCFAAAIDSLLCGQGCLQS